MHGHTSQHQAATLYLLYACRLTNARKRLESSCGSGQDAPQAWLHGDAAEECVLHADAAEECVLLLVYPGGSGAHVESDLGRLQLLPFPFAAFSVSAFSVHSARCHSHIEVT